MMGSFLKFSLFPIFYLFRQDDAGHGEADLMGWVM